MHLVEARLLEISMFSPWIEDQKLPFKGPGFAVQNPQLVLLTGEDELKKVDSEFLDP